MVRASFCVPPRQPDIFASASAYAARHAEGGGYRAQHAQQRLQDEFPSFFLLHVV